MHAIANSPPPSSSSSEATNEILAELIASLFLSRPSLNSIDRAERSVPYPSRGKLGFDVSQLPVEIICEIFERFMEDDSVHPVFDDTPRPLVSYTCRSDPTKLGQICSRWRAVAISLPKMWSNILIYNPKPSQVYLTEVWLKRSGNKPLSLEIDYNYDTGYDLRSAAQILRSFMAHLGRWKKFQLNMSTKLLKLLSAIPHSPHKPLILESVNLYFHDIFHSNHPEVRINEADAIWKYFDGCPTLRRVFWHNQVNRFPKHAPSQLTHIQAHFSVSIDDILSFLPQIPLIEELQFGELRLPTKNPPTTASDLLAEHLRVLKIRSYNVAASSLLERLTCPSLDCLEIIHCNDISRPEANQDLQELPRFLRRSGCHLLKLKLCDPAINITDDALTRCLSDSPLRSLKSLYIDMDHISEQTVEFLSSKSAAEEHEFAPCLEDLSLFLWEIGDGLLARMVSSRWHEALDDNHSTPLGHLRKAGIFPKNHFGPIDEAFFSLLR
ncbi:hypothetical protein M413DRAFT_32615 [Hebeloma cylindrosporum]|uniref:Uncharacterized protein n=1 Tax=Hebeloma cylindrosporum TaxID=76867 RepID=A0A0C3BV40_HEBCY|nr:hypothetical protein M413DRAFT_32615 [Hebeloma cylindrosporum h7]